MAVSWSIRQSAGALALVLFAAHCSSDSKNASTGSGVVGPSPCKNGLLEGCGEPCVLMTDCEPGLHCADGECTADCTPGGNQCADNYVCDQSGYCEQGMGPLIVGQKPDGGIVCIQQEVRFEQVPPTVIMLIDRSGSMVDEFDRGLSRWESVRRTLMDPTDGVVAKLQNEVQFGLMLYTSFDGLRGGQCPILVEVDPAMSNFSNIQNVYAGAEIQDREDDTPTAEALRAAADKLLSLKTPGAKVIALATDGEPDTCEDADAHNGNTNRRSVQTVKTIFSEGITTRVISVGDDVGQQHLQDLANAGLGVQSGAEYFRALNAASLENAFDLIVRGVVSCEFTLNGNVQMGYESSGRVVLDGQSLDFNDPNGWSLPSRNVVRLEGAACEAVKTAEENLKIEFPCGSFVLN